jgi:hypothetical protein
MMRHDVVLHTMEGSILLPLFILVYNLPAAMFLLVCTGLAKCCRCGLLLYSFFPHLLVLCALFSALCDPYLIVLGVTFIIII